MHWRIFSDGELFGEERLQAGAVLGFGKSTFPRKTARTTMPSGRSAGLSSSSICFWISARLVEKISRTVFLAKVR